MKRLTLDVSRWNVWQHRQARGLPTVDKHDTPERAFSDELFDRLYSGDDSTEKLSDADRDPKLAAWADRVHETCAASPSFRRLVDTTRGSAVVAGLAVESLMQELQPMMDPESANKNQPKEAKDAIRFAVGRGVALATAKVEDVQEAMEGLGIVAGYGPTGEAGDGVDPEKIRNLAKDLRNSAKLKKLAKLAGRFKRLAVQKHAQKVRHGVDEISDITKGADISRLLPSEAMRLINPTLRLAFMRDFYERSLTQYELTGKQTKAAGPIVALLDKSSSMAERGSEKDVYATAVALALAEIAAREKRAFCLISFDDNVLDNVLVKAGEKLPERILMRPARGGTNIAAAYSAALDVISKSPGQIAKADIVLISDGESDDTAAVALRQQAKTLGVTSFGISIGGTLGPWCDAVADVNDLDSMDDTLATKLFAA